MRSAPTNVFLALHIHGIIDNLTNALAPNGRRGGAAIPSCCFSEPRAALLMLALVVLVENVQSAYGNPSAPLRLKFLHGFHSSS